MAGSGEESTLSLGVGFTGSGVRIMKDESPLSYVVGVMGSGVRIKKEEE